MKHLKIVYSSDEYIDYPDAVCVEFTTEEIERLERLIQVAEDNDCQIKVKMTPVGEFLRQELEKEELGDLLVEWDDEKDEDNITYEAYKFEPELEYIHIHPDGDMVYSAYVENGNYFESEFFNLKDLK